MMNTGSNKVFVAYPHHRRAMEVAIVRRQAWAARRLALSGSSLGSGR
jgi:hypothetical protein